MYFRSFSQWFLIDMRSSTSQLFGCCFAGNSGAYDEVSLYVALLPLRQAFFQSNFDWSDRFTHENVEEAVSWVDALLSRGAGYKKYIKFTGLSEDVSGTVEFLVDSKKNFFFLEMNTRLQVCFSDFFAALRCEHSSDCNNHFFCWTRTRKFLFDLKNVISGVCSVYSRSWSVLLPYPRSFGAGVKLFSGNNVRWCRVLCRSSIRLLKA